MNMESEYSIKRPSQELFLETIRTVPLQPRYANSIMLADGVSPGWPGNEKSEAPHLAACVQRGIIPFSAVTFRNFEEHGFIPEWPSTDTHVTYRGLSRTGRAYAIDELLKGGRVHQIVIETALISDGFERFKSSLLNRLLANGYQFDWGDLCLSTYRGGGCYDKGEYRNGGLIFNARGSRAGLEMQLWSGINEDTKKLLVEWFQKLAEKYGQPPLLPVRNETTLSVQDKA